MKKQGGRNREAKKEIGRQREAGYLEDQYKICLLSSLRTAENRSKT